MNKTVLVTGGAGYIGGHCVISLLESGFKPVIFDNLSSGHIETVNALKKCGDLEFIKGDLLNKESIKKVFDNIKIDAVMHFAAFSIVSESAVNPEKYYINNVSGALNLFEAMLAHKVNKLIFSSTAAVYGEPVYTPIDEKHPLNPVNTYGRTKLMIENILEDYDRAYGLKSARLRYFNAAGADPLSRTGEMHDNETHLIPNILKAALGKSRTFELYGDKYNTKDGTCLRDYVNIEDLARAHILALDYLFKGGGTDVFNLGSGGGSTVKEVFQLCREITGKEIPVKICPARAGDPSILTADNAKARAVLGWKPEKTLKDSIESAYKWEIANIRALKN